MEDRLHARGVGQDEAVRLVADAIRRSRAGLSEESRPVLALQRRKPSRNRNGFLGCW
jgi:ATP-dependent Clp protease ATP-binding subunit ClpA